MYSKSTALIWLVHGWNFRCKEWNAQCPDIIKKIIRDDVSVARKPYFYSTYTRANCQPFHLENFYPFIGTLQVVEHLWSKRVRICKAVDCGTGDSFHKCSMKLNLHKKRHNGVISSGELVLKTLKFSSLCSRNGWKWSATVVDVDSRTPSKQVHRLSFSCHRAVPSPVRLLRRLCPPHPLSVCLRLCNLIPAQTD